MGPELDARAFESGLAFLEDTANSVKSGMRVRFDGRNRGLTMPADRNTLQAMSFADIKEQAALLPFAERLDLTRYLTALESEEEHRALLSQRMKAMDGGRKVTLEAFIDEHHRLETEGR